MLEYYYCLSYIDNAAYWRTKNICCRLKGLNTDYNTVKIKETNNIIILSLRYAFLWSG